MSTNLVNDLLADYCRSLKDYTEAVIREADEEEVQALSAAALDAAAVFDDAMFDRYGYSAPVERQWLDEDEESDDAAPLDEERMVARVRFLSTGAFTQAAFRALDEHADGWVTIAGGLGLAVEQFDVRVEPVDDHNWDE